MIVRFCAGINFAALLSGEMGITYQVEALEDLRELRLVIQHLSFVRDRPFNDAVFFLVVIVRNATEKLPHGFQGLLLVTVASMEPRGFGDDGPADYHESDGRPQDAHSKKVLVGILGIDLLHHHVADDATDAAPTRESGEALEGSVRRLGENLPHCLEGDHAAADSVWSDFHDIDLARDPG